MLGADMRRTVYKNSDWASATCDYTPNVKLDSVVIAPYLVEKVFINEKTSKRVTSDFLQLVVFRSQPKFFTSTKTSSSEAKIFILKKHKLPHARFSQSNFFVLMRI